MRISDWSSDVCSSDLRRPRRRQREKAGGPRRVRACRTWRRSGRRDRRRQGFRRSGPWRRTASGCAMRARIADARCRTLRIGTVKLGGACLERADHLAQRAIEHLPRQHLEQQIAKREIDAENQNTTIRRSEEHTSELQSLMRISYAVFCLKKKKQNITN